MNVRSVSKMSAAVMTLAILSYCGKKSHDAAAPAPAPEPKSEAGTVPANTATTYLQPSCQTADEINTHVTNVDRKAEAFCFHKVEHPAVSLSAGQAIATDLQLKQGLDMAFLNVVKDFDGAQASCTSLGAGWHAPLINNQDATPQAAGNSNSLEAVGSYFKGSSGLFSRSSWSSSTVSSNTSSAWYVNLAAGNTSHLGKYFRFAVVCVKP